MPRPLASTTARGYGYQHQAKRRAWKTRVNAGGVNCWRCGHPIPPGSRWELGHDDHDRTITRGPEHYLCNRRAAERKTHAIKRAKAASQTRWQASTHGSPPTTATLTSRRW